MSLYIMITFGEQTETFDSEEEALCYAYDHVAEMITAQHRHDLPLKVTPEMRRQFDVRLIEVGDDYNALREVELPFQKWADTYYENLRLAKKDEADREYQTYLRLKEKFEGRDEKRDTRARLKKEILDRYSQSELTEIEELIRERLHGED